MYYILNDNVYLVDGAVNSCLYDFNSGNLYSINKDLYQKLALANNGQLAVENLSSEDTSFFKELLQMHLLKLSEKRRFQSITDLISYDNKFDMAWIEVTTRCNLKCIHCYNESDIHQNTVMPFDTYKLLVQSLLKLGIKQIQFIGGEPFCEKVLLKEMLDFAIGKFPSIEVFTNGTLFTPEWFPYLSQNNIRVALSVYSYNSCVHDKVTRYVGSWAKTNQTIDLLKKHNIKYRVCNVLMRDVSLGQKSTDLYRLNKNKDVVRMTGRACFSLLSDDLIRKRLITPKTFESPIQKNFCQRLISGHNCFKNKLYIASDMNVYPCVMERRLKHCQVSSDGAININEHIRNLNKDCIEECNKCEFRYACFDCRPNSLSGNILEKPWYCTYNPSSGKWEDEEIFIKKLKVEWSD